MNLMIRKRNGVDVPFDKTKIVNALRKSNTSVSIDEQLDLSSIINIADTIEQFYKESDTLASVETVQDKVVNEIMVRGKFKLANSYIIYRYQHELLRKKNTTDDQVFQIVDGTSEEIREENSNKNTDIIPTQRDYIAGIVSKDMTQRYLLPEDINTAHNDGLIHVHDLDYFITREHNCGLVNLDDMLQNGTVISETMIERPHRFSTACNIATQIVAQVASSQYGGQSISMTHLAKFVDVSRKAIRKDVIREFESAGVVMLYSEDQVEKITEMRLRKEVNAGIQTIQYQVLTLMTTNGQTPFITVYLNLGEAGDDKVLKNDLALCIEETLQQRIDGIKNEVGVPITAAFPKLIYVLDEDNIHKDSPYYYLTELAAKCTAKRMVPDYISAKVMRELKGDVYTCMGCVDGSSKVKFYHNGCGETTTTIEDMWNYMSKEYNVNIQPNGRDLYIETPGVLIYDDHLGMVECHGIIRNHSTEWCTILFNNGHYLRCTHDHPFTTGNRGVVKAIDLTHDDIIAVTGCNMVSRILEEKEEYSYDVTTASEHFTVNGIYSHNCRSFLTPDRFTDTKHENVANAKNWKLNEHKYYGRLTTKVKSTINRVNALSMRCA